MSHWFRTAYRHMDLWVTFLWFRFLAARVVLGDKFTQRFHFFWKLFELLLRHFLHRAASIALSMIGFLSNNHPLAQYNCRSRWCDRKFMTFWKEKSHRSLHTPKVKPGVKVGNSWQFDFRSGCRNVSHQNRQQSFSGLHSPGRSNYTITC